VPVTIETLEVTVTVTFFGVGQVLKMARSPIEMGRSREVTVGNSKKKITHNFALFEMTINIVI